VSAITLVLPVPPSANSYWRSVSIGGRSRVLLSKRGREYKQLVRGIAIRERVQRFGAHVRVELAIVIHFPDKRRRDVSNTVKAAEDSLKGWAFVDDEQVDRLVVERGSIDRGNPRIEVTITPMGEVRAAA
jgi:crossover junction endodeoxyribonuclease RusA